MAPGVEVGEITTHGLALSRLRHGFESRLGATRSKTPSAQHLRFFVEQVHDLLEILRREPRVDRRLNVGVTQVLLHRAEVAAGALEQFDAARMAKRMRVDGVHADSLAEILDDLPDALTRHAPGLLLTAVPLVLDLEQRLTRRRRSLLRQVFVQDGVRETLAAERWNSVESQARPGVLVRRLSAPCGP